MSVAVKSQAVMLKPTEGEAFSIIGGGVRILMDGSTSGGQCVMFEGPVSAGDGPPLHRHEYEDELFYVLEGKFKFQVDGKVFIAEPGAFACAPRGSIHAFRNIGNTTGKLLITCTPAGLEKPFRAVQIPPAGSGRTPLTMEELLAEFSKHGITFHGPPLEE
jgi:quercetin dioxygenase-like cupin family protein